MLLLLFGSVSIDPVYLGVAGQAMIYLGERAPTVAYIGTKVLFP